MNAHAMKYCDGYPHESVEIFLNFENIFHNIQTSIDARIVHCSYDVNNHIRIHEETFSKEKGLRKTNNFYSFMKHIKKTIIEISLSG